MQGFANSESSRWAANNRRRIEVSIDGAEVLTFVDIDSMLRRVDGKQKQGIGFGHAKVGGYNVWLRGYDPLINTICTPAVGAGDRRGPAAFG